MSILERLFSESPFRALSQHTEKVHECVELIRPIVEALLEENFDKTNELQYQMSKTEHEADLIKTQIREMLSSGVMLAVKREDLSHYLAYQDDVADAAEDFAVVASIRKTKIHPELTDDLRAFAEQVIHTSETMLKMATNLGVVARGGFGGRDAKTVIEGAIQLGEEEWQADKLQRKFARHCYELEEQLDPVTIMFYEKICSTLSAIANKAENTGKFLHMLIAHR